MIQSAAKAATLSTPTKGDRTRSAILDQAMSVASRLGLEGLTIGTLAEASGMSKSGLFAHFGSREELQLAVLAHGSERFGEVVAQPAFQHARGLPRLRALLRNWMDWSANAGLPGGCVLLAAAFEYDDRPGAVRDAVVQTQKRGMDMMEKAVRLAVDEGHLCADTAVKSLVFDLYGVLLAYYHHGRLLRERDAHAQALAAFEKRIAPYLSDPAKTASKPVPKLLPNTARTPAKRPAARTR